MKANITEMPDWNQPQPAAQVVGGSLTLDRFGRAGASPASRTDLFAVGVLGLLILVWACLALGVPGLRFAVYAPGLQNGIEATAMFARLLGVLVLLLFSRQEAGDRLRWVGAGFGVLSLGSFCFGYVPLMLALTPDLNILAYASLVVRGIADFLFVVGLILPAPPRFDHRSALLVVALFSLACLAGAIAVERLPPLVVPNEQELITTQDYDMLWSITGWYIGPSIMLLGLSLAVVVGAVRRVMRGMMMGRWVLVAMVLLAGAHFHNLFWPSTYSPMLTTGDLLMLASASVIAVGGIIELRRIASEREILLAAEQEQIKRLTDLAKLKADFSMMIAHELGNPLAAIRGFADVLGLADLDIRHREEALSIIRKETDLLAALIEDVNSVATVDRVDFAVQLRPTPLGTIVADAEAFAQTLPGNHPFSRDVIPDVMVLADPYRIGQVLHNLLSNAAKYSAPGTPIELRLAVDVEHIWLIVVDKGYGISPDNVERIFVKFERGHDELNRKVPGLGLGLYLSRRIVQAHGSGLEVRSQLGVGSEFAFKLEVAR